MRTIGEDGEHLRTVAVHHPDPQRQSVLRAFFATPLHVRECLAARVLATGEPLLLEHIDTQALRSSFDDESHRTGMDRGAPHSLIAAALAEGSERIGMVMMIHDHTPRPYTANDLSLLQDLTERATMALTRTGLYVQSQQERRRALAIANASRAFTAAEHDPRAILDLLARVVVAEVGELAVANLISDDGAHVQPVAFHAEREVTEEVQALFATRTPLASTLTERIAATGQPLRLSSLEFEKLAAGAGARRGSRGRDRIRRPVALGSAAELQPDVALLDIGLPVMDGYDLARRLKAALPSSPRLVAITGYGQEHDHQRSQEAGFDAHLVKPVQAAQVLAVVDDSSR